MYIILLRIVQHERLHNYVSLFFPSCTAAGRAHEVRFGGPSQKFPPDPFQLTTYFAKRRIPRFCLTSKLCCIQILVGPSAGLGRADSGYSGDLKCSELVFLQVDFASVMKLGFFVEKVVLKRLHFIFLRHLFCATF